MVAGLVLIVAVGFDVEPAPWRLSACREVEEADEAEVDA